MSFVRSARFFWAPLLFGLGLLACASGPTSVTADLPPDGAGVRARVLASARSLLGQRPDALVTVRGRQFQLDCIGTLSAAWWGAGHDLQRDFAHYAGNGVLRLYNSLKDHQALAPLQAPQPGDIVFWENTYDRNDDGIRYNDGITHAGLVVSLDDEGTVTYLHESVSRGVVLAYFNVKHPTTAFGPAGQVWNSPMYLGSGYDRTDNPPHWLSGDLIKAVADAEKTANLSL